MRLGISSYTYTWAIGVPGYPPLHPLDAVGLLEKAAQLDVRLVQFADNLPLDALSPGEWTRFQQVASTLSVSIEVGTRGVAPDHFVCTWHWPSAWARPSCAWSSIPPIVAPPIARS